MLWKFHSFIHKVKLGTQLLKYLINVSYHHFKEIHQHFDASSIRTGCNTRGRCSHPGTSEFDTISGWWGGCCRVKKRSWSIIKVSYSIPAHIVLCFARHVLYQSPRSLKEMSLFSVALKSLWHTVLLSMIKCERTCLLFWGHSVLFFSSFWKSSRITREIS